MDYRKIKKRVKASGNKKLFKFFDLTTIVMVAFILAMLFSPDFKGAFIRGIMNVGFLQPDIPETEKLNAGKPPVAQISFTNETGDRIQLFDLKGKVVFINFWATWCPPCLAEMPSINKLSARYKDRKDVVFIMVDVDGNTATSTAFMKKHGYSLPVFIPAGQIPKEYFSGTLPTTVIVDKAGRIVFSETGAADYGNPKVSAFIDELVK